jgi:hypothetical protein
MTPSKIGRAHLILGSGLMLFGVILMFDVLSSGGTGQQSWFFRSSYHEVEWFWGLCALAVGFTWVTGRVGWWIVQNLIQLWLHKVWKDTHQRY